ncbi:MAG: secretin N-terminal domain-containing protein, partial [Burkholderiales bacterium]
MKPSHPASPFAHFCAALQPACRKILVPLVGVLSVVALAGCAAQMNYREGQKLVANNNMDAGLAKFGEAVQADPDNIEYKAAYARTRERLIAADLEQADHLREAGNRQDAARLYQRILAIDPDSGSAHAGMQQLAREARHETLLNEAGALQGKDPDEARAKLAIVLNENPKNEKARAMLRAMDARIAAKVDSPSLESLLAATYKKPITIEFKDAPLKQVFDLISRTSGLNILFDKDVKLDQKTSIYLKNSTIEAAIYYMLLINQLEQQVMDANTLLIYPSGSAKQKDYQQMVVKTFTLANGNAKAIGETLKSILKSHDVVVDDKLNMIIVRDSPEAIRMAEKLVAAQDVAEPEVMLDVEILEVSRERLTQLGVTWPSSMSLTPLSTTTTDTTTTIGTGTGVSVVTSPTTNPLTLANLIGINRAGIGVTVNPIVLNAGVTDSDVNILTNPRIRVLNHEKAKIMIGSKVPEITNTTTATGLVAQSVTYLDVGLKLEVEPSIYLDSEVAIKMSLEVSNILNTQTNSLGTTTYTIGTRAAATMLRLKDG